MAERDEAAAERRNSAGDMVDSARPRFYRRLIDIQAHHAGEITAWMEDNFHHFAIRVRHDGTTVTNVEARALRTPWSTCGTASGKLQSLIGRNLVPRSSAIGDLLEMRMQCTHMFDLAGLALAAAANGIRHRTYEATVTLREPLPVRGAPHTGKCVAVLCCDAEEVLRWVVEDEAILLPNPRSLLRGFRAWTETLSEGEAEAALVLRRAVDVSGGLSFDTDLVASPLDLGLPAVCHSYQPDQAALARRNKGTAKDFSSGFANMLADRRFPPP